MHILLGEEKMLRAVPSGGGVWKAPRPPAPSLPTGT